MQAEIQPIFATAVYKKILRAPSKDELKFLSNTITSDQNSGNLMSDSRNILESLELLNLKNLFLECIQEYIDNILHVNNEFYITDSWFNITKHKQHHKLHNHNNSILSGCYYISVEKSQPTISFKRLDYPFLFDFFPLKFNTFNSVDYSLPVKDNMLILFPSSCYHYVNSNPTLNERYSISFDTFVKGHIGNNQTSNLIL